MQIQGWLWPNLSERSAGRRWLRSSKLLEEMECPFVKTRIYQNVIPTKSWRNCKEYHRYTPRTEKHYRVIGTTLLWDDWVNKWYKILTVLETLRVQQAAQEKEEKAALGPYPEVCLRGRPPEA